MLLRLPFQSLRTVAIVPADFILRLKESKKKTYEKKLAYSSSRFQKSPKPSCFHNFFPISFLPHGEGHFNFMRF